MGKKNRSIRPAVVVQKAIEAVHKAITPAEKAAAETKLQTRMVQAAALASLTLPPSSERHDVRVTVIPPEVVRGRTMRRHGLDDEGNRYDLAMEVLHRVMDRRVYDGTAFVNPRTGRELVLFYDAAGKDAVDEYNRTHPDQPIMGTGLEPLWRLTIARGRKARCIISVRGRMERRGSKFAAGKPWGSMKFAMVANEDKGLRDTDVIMVIESESPTGLHGVLTSAWVDGMILNPLTDVRVGIAVGGVIPIPISDALLGRPMVEIDPDSIFGFGRWWMDNAWQGYLEPAKAVGVAIPEDQDEAKGMAMHWWSEKGQVSVRDALAELEGQMDELPSIHTRQEALRVLGLPAEAELVDALKVVDALRKAETPEAIGRADPIIAWMKASDIAWAGPKVPMARKARVRVIRYARAALNRPVVMVEVKVNKSTKVPVDAWGLLRPSGRDEASLRTAVEEGREEADAAAETKDEGSLVSERLGYANAALERAGQPPLDMSRGPDKARFIACLNQAGENIKAELARIEEERKKVAAAAAAASTDPPPTPTVETSTETPAAAENPPAATDAATATS